MRPVTRALIALSSAQLLALACGSDDTSEPIGPAGPPELRITGLLPSGGPSWSAGDAPCVELGRDPAGTVIVQLYTEAGQIPNWYLRPPGVCSATPQCGVAVLYLDGTEAVASASPNIALPLAGVALGPHTIRVELRSEDDTIFPSSEGGPLASEVSIELSAVGACGAAIDAGGDAGTSDAGADAADDADDAALDAADGSGEAGTDAGDAEVDATSDAPTDAPAESAPDAGTDSGDAAG